MATYLVTTVSCNSYYRFTCEKCGCRTHWIPIKVTAVVPKEQEINPEKAMNEKIRKLKEVLDGCVAGRRMLIELEPADVFEFVGKCPKCKHEQSWAPRLASGLFKKTRQKRADKFNAAPVLSKPDFVYGGDLPEEDEHDFQVPCTLVIKHSVFGVLNNSPIYLNGKLVGHSEDSWIDLTLETYYRDNLIAVMLPQNTSYVEAEEGKTIQLKYRQGLAKKV